MIENHNFWRLHSKTRWVKVPCWGLSKSPESPRKKLKFWGYCLVYSYCLVDQSDRKNLNCHKGRPNSSGNFPFFRVLKPHHLDTREPCYPSRHFVVHVIGSHAV